MCPIEGAHRVRVGGSPFEATGRRFLAGATMNVLLVARDVFGICVLFHRGLS